MTKRRVTGVLCTLLAVIILCICEWVTIIIGNPNTTEKIISGIIYTYLSMFACIDLFYALNGNSYYPKEYHLFSFFKQLALTVFVAIILMLILGIIYNEKMNAGAIILLIIAGILECIAIACARKQCKKCLESSNTHKDIEH